MRKYLYGGGDRVRTCIGFFQLRYILQPGVRSTVRYTSILHHYCKIVPYNIKLAREIGFEPTCVQLAFLLVRSQRAYTLIMAPTVGNAPTFHRLQRCANLSQLSGVRKWSFRQELNLRRSLIKRVLNHSATEG